MKTALNMLMALAMFAEEPLNSNRYLHIGKGTTIIRYSCKHFRKSLKACCITYFGAKKSEEIFSSLLLCSTLVTSFKALRFSVRH